MIHKEIPECIQLYKKYEDLLINQSFSKAARINNMRALLSLGRIAKKENIAWDTITKDQVNRIVSFIMRTWADPDGQETCHTADHKKFLMLLVRWVKTGRRKYSRKHPEPEEILDITIKKVPQKLTREDMLTVEEEAELLNACGENIRDKAFIAVHAESGSRPGEILNLRIGHVEFLQNGGAIIKVDGKTGDRPIHLIRSVPHLAAWLEAHSYKDDPTSPLWISVANGMYGQNLSYSGARRMIQRRCQIAISKAKAERRETTINTKRITMLVFRHTEITRVSKWMNESILKKRHGWSKTSRMAANYEHLSHDDVGNAIFERYGLENSSSDEIEQLPKKCPICEMFNPSDSIRCSKCGKLLDLKIVIEIEEQEKEKKENLKSEIDELKERLNKKEQEDRERHESLLELLKQEHQKGSV